MVDTSALWNAVLLGALLYAAAGTVLLVRAVIWLRRRPGTGDARGPGPGLESAAARRLRRTWRWLGHALLATAACGPLSLLWARLVEPFRPQVERLRVETDRLPPGAGPIRLVLIADTHCDPEARAEPRVARIVRDLQPHAIVFAGDAVNCPEGLPHFRQLMQQLAGIAPTWAVGGNWEAWWFGGLNLFGGTGAEVLDGRAVPVRAGPAEIWLAGFPVLDGRKGFSPEVNAAHARRALAAVPPGRFTVFVHHYPEVAEIGLRLGAGLALAGDTHGGQVRLPLLGELVRLNRMGRHWTAGAHRLPGGGTLYVNRGLGLEGGSAPRIRFLCRPEITLIEVVPADRPPRHQDTKQD